MTNIKNHKIATFLFSIFLLIFTGCNNTIRKDYKVVGLAQKEKQGDLKEILNKQKLTILVENSASTYFIYRGQKMGFEYDILHEFAKEIGVQLEVKIVKDLDNMIPFLVEGKGDIIACNFTVTKERKEQISFSDPILRTAQVLVQRKPEGWQDMSQEEIDSKLISDPVQLSEKTIYVWSGSSYYQRIKHLQKELGDTIIIKPLDGDIIPEKAMEMVAKGFINYTVIDGNVAKMNRRYYPNVDIDLKLSVKQRIAFGLRKSSPLLKRKLNTWLKKFKKTPTYHYLMHQYFSTPSFTYKAKSKYSSVSGKNISPYDAIVKRIAKRYGWDWRLISAVIYQESKFDISQTSWVGAYGLMQFMPSVGPAYGVFPYSPADIQIKGGVKKLSEDYRYWKSIPDSIQRVKFTLGTYNAGLGHVLDAQRLAKKYGKSPIIWDDNVELFIKNLSDPKYYYDPVVRYGYLRGAETFNYVRNIFSIYHEYKSLFPPNPLDNPS